MERFWSKVLKLSPDDCWEWRAGKFSSGHGSFDLNGKTVTAHRLAYELSNGPIPEGTQVRHTCYQPSCVNPRHLLVGTVARGDDHWSRRSPEKVAKGDKHGFRTHPEAVLRGEKHPSTRLSDEQIAEIRRRYSSGSITQRELAAEYGCSPVYISRVVRLLCRRV